MANTTQESNLVDLTESRIDNSPLLSIASNHDDTPSQERVNFQSARRPLSLSVLKDISIDLIATICCAYFIVFAALVYTRRGQALDQPGNQALLEASKYTPTLFPILFAAVVAKFLKVVAAIKLEKGTSVLSLEYLLLSRTVFNTIMVPINLRTINFLTPFLFLLWALSPLGGQAGLRLIYTQEALTNTTQNFTHLAFVSPFTNEGIDSASASLLTPINALFTAAVIGSAKAKNLPQDQYGNAKVPIYESLPLSSSKNDSDWRRVPNLGEFEWSSLTGLPVHNLPSTGISYFTMNTGYMITTCNTSGHDWARDYRQSLEQYQGWSGANYAITPGFDNPYLQVNFTFRSLSYPDDASKTKVLTIANCNVTMRYVEVQIRCDGQSCESTAARPSKSPAMHDLMPGINTVNAIYYTPINGLGQKDIMYLSFFPDFTNATSPTVGCDTVNCPPGAIEAYLVDPTSLLLQTSTSKIWQVGNELISQRFTQLINTYWINSIAPYGVSGNFSLAYSDFDLAHQYNIDSTIGTVINSEIVVKCDLKWFAIMIICSAVLFIAGLATVLLIACRRGPDVLDTFSSLLRDNPYANIPHESSMEDAVDQSRRLRDMKVRIGDVRPEEEVGYIAIGLLDENHIVQKLSTRRRYA